MLFTPKNRNDIINVDNYLKQIGLSKNQRKVWTSYIRIKNPRADQTKSQFENVNNAEPLQTETMWQKNEPNNHKGRQNCGVTWYPGMDDDFCTASHRVVCEC